MSQDKGKNWVVIDWLKSWPGSSPFLVTPDRVWSYRQTLAEVEPRLVDELVVVTPSLQPDSVFDLLAAISGGGAVVLGPGQTRAGSGVSDATGGARLIVFTSGTSGESKGVRLTAANLTAACRGSMDHLGHGPKDRWLLAMPLHHVGGLSILLRSAYAGGSVHLLSGFDPPEVAGALRSGVTMVSLVPTMLSRLLDHDPGPYPDLRAVLVGGGPIPTGLLERAASAGIPALPTYGMTETFGQVATLRPGSKLERKAHPLPGVELRIESDGRIAVSGAQVSPGYLGQPDRSDRWLVTNDIGTIDNDGALTVVGRSDAVIITGGENVDPARVEAELATHPGIGDVLVVGLPDEEWGQVVACLYTGPGSVDELAAWIRGKLPGHMIPKLWRRVDEIPTIGPGKPDRVRAVELWSGGD